MRRRTARRRRPTRARPIRADDGRYDQRLYEVKQLVQKIDDLLMGVPGSTQARMTLSKLNYQVSNLPK